MNASLLRVWPVGAVVLLAGAFILVGMPAAAKEPDLETLASDYTKEIRPILQRYCTRCHSAQRTEADIDLDAIGTFADVRKHPQTWQKVGEMLDSGQMPPREARKPSAEERTHLQDWVRGYLMIEARSRAGDPGPVVLRRLSNAEYTYTLRDLTGVTTLEPAREFPVDGAAGEGFTNTGNALVMSPALLTKYLDAGKEVARHAVLLPDGFRFSPYTTRNDWTNAILAEIRDFYREFTDATGGTRVNLQGIISETNQGGRIPLARYLTATLAEREHLKAGTRTIAEVARTHGLNARYLETLWKSLTITEPSVLLDGLRARWQMAKPAAAPALAADIAAWQKELWRFTTVGHIGKVGGPKRWLEPVSPLTARQELRLKLPATTTDQDVAVSFVAASVEPNKGPGTVIWERARLTAPGRPDMLLRDVPTAYCALVARRQRMFANAAQFLRAAAEAQAQDGANPADLARKHNLDAEELRAWLDYLGIGTRELVQIHGSIGGQLTSAAGYNFVQGWGSHNTPLVLANSSDQHVRIPGNMRPHSVAVHPSPTLRVGIGWRCVEPGSVRVEGKVIHAHPECGNGVTWLLEVRRGATRQRLQTGTAQGTKEVPFGPIDNVAVRPGDYVSLLVAPRNGNHACDLTTVEFKLTSTGEDRTVWNLAEDVSKNILVSNPHADRHGNPGVWLFYTEADKDDLLAPIVPAGSLLARWQTAGAADKEELAKQVQQLLSASPPPKESPDGQLYRQVAAPGGPLLRGLLVSPPEGKPDPDSPFGKHPAGMALDSANLAMAAPGVVTVKLPAELAVGCELVTTGTMDKESAQEGSAQLQVVLGAPAKPPVLQPGPAILALEGTAARRRLEAGLEEYRQLFPAALCYTRIVPVDEVVTLTLFYREDDHLVRLMLDEKQGARLDKLWSELHFVSQDALTLVDAFAQLLEYASQDGDPKLFEPLRKPIHERAAAFRQLQRESEPRQLDALVAFAGRVYRRPLTSAETQDLRQLYDKLRKQELSHDEALRLTLARLFVAPTFLYRLEKAGAGKEAVALSDHELSNRLSYFLWSSLPDEELQQLAASGRLRTPDTLVAQTRRMLTDARTRRLATEFACQWLHIYDFDHLDEKSERHFPTFVGLRGAMYEESIRFFTDLFQRDGSVLDILDADYTFLNEPLAKHYGIPGVSGPEWRRVTGIKKFNRGGILGQATTLAKQSGASRTSPILRGNWISEVLLGERLPRPPKDVPQLPEDEAATEGLTMRQLVEKHSSDPRCAVCHQRIDAFGFSLESFDAIGRRREKDLGDRVIDTRVKTMDGTQFADVEGLRSYLLTQRRDAFLRQFCRKLLGYALGRAVQLSDEPLLTEMQTQLKAWDYRFTVAVETIVRSRQFREIRGRLAANEN